MTNQNDQSIPPRDPSYIPISETYIPVDSALLWPEHWNVLRTRRETGSSLSEAVGLVSWLGSKFGAKSGWEKERDRTEQYPRIVRTFIYDDLGYSKGERNPRTKKINREELSTANWQDIYVFWVSIVTNPKTNSYIGHLVESYPPLPSEGEYIQKTVICQTCKQPHIAAIEPGAFRPEYPNTEARFMWLGAHPDCQDFPELNRNDANNGPWVERFTDVRYFDVDSIEYWNRKYEMFERLQRRRRMQK